jgi:hypothetical protein
VTEFTRSASVGAVRLSPPNVGADDSEVRRQRAVSWKLFELENEAIAAEVATIKEARRICSPNNWGTSVKARRRDCYRPREDGRHQPPN